MICKPEVSFGVLRAALHGSKPKCWVTLLYVAATAQRMHPSLLLLCPILQLHPPPMQRSNLLHKAQPQHRALLLRVRTGQRIELLKYLVLRVAGDARSLVAYGDLDPAALHLQAKFDVAALGRKVQRVVQQVADRPAQQKGVGFYRHVFPGGHGDAAAALRGHAL